MYETKATLHNSVRFKHHYETMKSSSAITVEVVYHTSPGTTTRTVRCGSLLEGLRLSTLKQDKHGGLRGSGRQSVIP
jgi:hypothetical protein